MWDYRHAHCGCTPLDGRVCVSVNDPSCLTETLREKDDRDDLRLLRTRPRGLDKCCCCPAAPLHRCLGSIKHISISVMAPARLSSFRGNDAIEANLRLPGLTNVSLSGISKDFILHSLFRVSLSSCWLSLTRFLDFIFCSSSSPLNRLSPLPLPLCLTSSVRPSTRWCHP